MTKNWFEHNILEKSLNRFKKDFNQAFVDKLQGKYVALVDGNVPSSYFTCGVELRKIWLKLKSLCASHTMLSEAFQDVRNLQCPPTLRSLDMKKEKSLKMDKLIELTTLLPNEVNSLQGIVETLE